MVRQKTKWFFSLSIVLEKREKQPGMVLAVIWAKTSQMKETWCALSFVYTDSTAALHRAMVNNLFIGLVNILSPLVLIMINQDHRHIVLVMSINIMSHNFFLSWSIPIPSLSWQGHTQVASLCDGAVYYGELTQQRLLGKDVDVVEDFQQVGGR